ncbi:cytochrome P450 [Tessaracoccus massiliensis]|uniref:cytochrome P450 n=1 Tax=Tessaracoccus massiliensis TaxID=1522311 RepID=UPI00058F1796|nr:cytochrome P450 [Tessaracoccus massiliensis]
MSSQRRAHKAGESPEPRIDRTGDVWRIRSLEAARQVLRARHATTQAGFTAEYVPQGVLKHHPILMSDGPLHDEQRAKVGRFFAPKVVHERHGDTIAQSAARCVDALTGEVALDEVALHYSVEVTSRIVGLTAAPPEKMAPRLVSFFRQPPLDITLPDLGRTRKQWMQAAWRGIVPIVGFYLKDVRPAIRRRRRQREGDVISHLIDEGYTNADILVESVTYGTAGMVTTREFITMAAWHLLGNPTLRDRYLVAEREERHAILNEIIRLEPVVGHLYRRAQEDIEITDGDETATIEAGDIVDVCVRQVNADPEAVGEEPLGLCPGRSLPRGVDGSVLTFGDGAHKCPGQPLAIFETDELLTRLLARRPEVLQEPSISWDDLIEGYILRGLILRV